MKSAKRLRLLVFSIYLVTLLFLSCSKKAVDTLTNEVEIENKFLFQSDALLDKDIIQVMEYLKGKSKKDQSIKGFIDKLEHISWKSTIKIKNNKESLIIVPFGDQSNKSLNGFFVAYQVFGSSDVTFEFFSKRHLNKYGYTKNQNKLNAFQVQSILNYFNFTTYQANKFDVDDLRFIKETEIKKFSLDKKKGKSFGKVKVIPRDESVQIFSSGSTITNGTTCFSFSEEVEWWYNPNGDACHCDGDEYYMYSTYEVQTICIETYGGGGWGGDGFGSSFFLLPTGGGGGSGGNTTGNNFYNFNKTDSDYGTGDDDNNAPGNYDNTSYSDFDDQTQPWPTFQNVIPISDFVGWNRILHPTWQCMDYAKAQIAKKGYRISNYFDIGQTIQIYTNANGADKNAAKNAVGYLISSLQRGIPIVVGVDDQVGSPNPNTDNTTDHFIVIVGSGSDANGIYFTFYDNASGDPTQGASINNKLYYNSLTGLITGKSQTDYAKASNRYDYIVTMVRKSK